MHGFVFVFKVLLAYKFSFDFSYNYIHNMIFFYIKITFVLNLHILGTLTLVDLAGSEKLDDAASVTTNQETKKINLSLMELSKVLRALRKKVLCLKSSRLNEFLSKKEIYIF